MLAAARERKTIAHGCLEFGVKRRVTSGDVRCVAGVVCRMRLPAGRRLARARVLCFLMDGVRVLDPVGMECERLGVYAELIGA
jgi:hypothetical protein